MFSRNVEKQNAFGFGSVYLQKKMFFSSVLEQIRFIFPFFGLVSNPHSGTQSTHYWKLLAMFLKSLFSDKWKQKQILQGLGFGPGSATERWTQKAEKTREISFIL